MSLQSMQSLEFANARRDKTTKLHVRQVTAMKSIHTKKSKKH